MADKITFSSAVLRGFSRNGTGGKATFTSSLTKSVCKVMGWTELPDFLTGASPEGDLGATSIELVPSQEQLRKFAFELEGNRVNGFEILRLELKGKKGKGHRVELRFTVTFTDKKGAAKLEQHMLTIGEGKCDLTVSYTKQTEIQVDVSDDDGQGELDGAQRKRAAGDDD